MKRCDRHSPAIAAIVAWWLSHIAGPAKALQYSRAAEQDERKGFPYTAAMEWRKAAELFPANTRAAEYSWRQWERIMRLRRRLAGPIGVAHVPALYLPPASTSSFTTEPGGDQILFAKAA
jgi:hypothetical protein